MIYVIFFSYDVFEFYFLGSALKEQSDEIAHKFPGVESVYVDVLENEDSLSELVEESDVVVSLLPYQLHAGIARLCIQNKTHLVTASYTSEEVKSLHNKLVLYVFISILYETK